ncbi:hypothetical protein AVEN_3752-1 [Araneus ventricosus]|uniref:Uncharacterized protein n=1 Tax=Araneus ventricosus TaxID=182803 RepID=A0A4Y2VIU7_ARAVE|nr:hypothetical protein AVEN_3752-1 [Araneus ventricosus]
MRRTAAVSSAAEKGLFLDEDLLWLAACWGWRDCLAKRENLPKSIGGRKKNTRVPLSILRCTPQLTVCVVVAMATRSRFYVSPPRSVVETDKHPHNLRLFPET